MWRSGDSFGYVLVLTTCNTVSFVAATQADELQNASPTNSIILTIGRKNSNKRTRIYTCSHNHNTMCPLQMSSIAYSHLNPMIVTKQTEVLSCKLKALVVDSWNFSSLCIEPATLQWTERL